MKKYFLLMMGALAVCAMEMRLGSAVCAMANETHGSGNVTRFAEVGISTRHLLVRRGVADNGVLLGGDSSDPLGVCTDEPLNGDAANVALLGVATGTLTMVASKAIAVGARLHTAVGGKVSDTVAPNTYSVGTALSSAAGDGDELEVQHAYPVMVVEAWVDPGDGGV